MRKLDGKVALITGAGSGIGRETAVLFAKEGARVVVADCVPTGGNRTVEMIKGAGGKASFLAVDVSKSTDIRRMISSTIEGYGRIDVLYNNAGIQCPIAPLADIAEEDWFRTLDTNMNSVYRCCKYAIPHMVKRGDEVIISTSSTLGLAGKATVAAYALSKAGIISLTRTMATEYGPFNIRVNCICPGVIDTPMGGPSGTAMDLRGVPLRKLGQPQDIARAALFLASDDSQYVTGISLVVDGGWVSEIVFPYKDNPPQ